MDISERMFKLLEEKNKKSIDLADILNVGTGQISTWKKRNTDPPSKYIPKICEFLGVSYEYLLTGKESRLAPTSTEDVDWLSLIHRLPEHKRNEFKSRIEGYLECYEESITADNPPLKKTGTDSLGK